MNKKVIVAGSVKSSNVVLETLIAEGIDVLKVYSLDNSKAENVSGYYPIHETAEKANIPYRLFTKLNDVTIVEEMKALAPDFIFVVGLSQIISKEIIDSAKEGTIGLHPAPLPRYRGRAAMVWQMLLKEKSSAVTMFFIDEGMDTGDIIVQEPFEISDTDYAEDLDRKGLVALEKAMKKVAGMIKKGHVDRFPQDESKAVYLLKRSPEDGEIDWNQSIYDIHLLIRAVSHPYPGAFSYYDGTKKVIIWRADILPNHKYIGINGQIAEKTSSGFDVVCKDGLLHVYDYEICETDEEKPTKLLVGHKLRGEK